MKALGDKMAVGPSAPLKMAPGRATAKSGRVNLNVDGPEINLAFCPARGKVGRASSG